VLKNFVDQLYVPTLDLAMKRKHSLVSCSHQCCYVLSTIQCCYVLVSVTCHLRVDNVFDGDASVVWLGVVSDGDVSVVWLGFVSDGDMSAVCESKAVLSQQLADIPDSVSVQAA